MSDEWNNYAMPFSDYLADMHGKFAIAITKRQYAIIVDYFPHEFIVVDLIKKTRPDIAIDSWGNALDPGESYNNGNLVLLGYPNYVLIRLPQAELLSHDQFECIKNILLEIKSLNEKSSIMHYGQLFEVHIDSSPLMDIESARYEKRIDELIQKLSTYVQDNVRLSEEVIIGEAFHKEKQIVS